MTTPPSSRSERRAAAAAAAASRTAEPAAPAATVPEEAGTAPASRVSRSAARTRARKERAGRALAGRAQARAGRSGPETAPAAAAGPVAGPGRAARAERPSRAARARRTGRAGRAGRNLPAAVGVGLGLGAVVVASLFIRKEAFLVVAAAAVVVGVWELRGALAQGRINVPLVPSLVGGVTMIVASYMRGGQALAVAFGLTCVAVLLWRVADGVEGAVRDITGGMFVAAYPSLLASFTGLLLAPDDGARRIFVFVLVTVCSDIGGYAVGVVFGRHPMAPSVSPKKSWEGFAGSVAACVIGGVVSVTLMLHGAWWVGVLVGLGAVVAATVGDLTESTIKRDLGIKDMGHLLPGHGGVMDRLDSLLLAAPVVWALLAVFVPAP